MTAADDLLDRIETTPELTELLAWPGDFYVERRDPVEELRLPSGLPLIPIAGDASGGTYFLLREDHPHYPAARTELLGLLDLAPPTVEEAVTRLRAAAARTVPDFLPIAVLQEGESTYEPL
jgi:hypothetical protein